MAQTGGDMRSRLLRLGRAARTADEAADDAREARDRAMYEANVELGWSLAEIAVLVDVDPTTVQRAVAKEQGRRQIIHMGDEHR